MKVKDWIGDIIDNGLLCREYTERVKAAQSKADFMNIILDINGVTFLQEMDRKGHSLSKDIILDEFAPYINGRYIGRYVNEDNTEYTSCIYCYHCYDVEPTTTLTTFIGCRLNVMIPENSYMMLFVDKDSELDVQCPKSSNVKIECWGECKVNIVGENHKGIKIKRR